MKNKTIKILDVNIRKIVCDLGLGKEYLDVTLKIWFKEKNNNQTLTKVKTLCSLKDIVKRIER